MNKAILIVGCGSIGRFHLLSILRSKKNFNITILDNAKNSLNEADIIYKENSNNSNLKLVKNISLIDQNYDLAIVAVSSDIRLKIFKELVKHTKIKYYVLEKFLFQKTLEYYEAKEIIKDNKLKVWVNCWRRSFNIYKQVKKNLKKNEKINMTITGNEWGLACNSIHFIDLFCWMNNYKSIILKNDDLKNEIKDSKRKGFVEFYGTLIGIKNENSIYMHCKESNKKSLVIELKTNNKRIEINELKGTLKITLRNKKKLIKFDSPRVSDLTYPIINDILNFKKCLLPTYNESAKLHLIILNSMIDKAQKIKKNKINYLKIT